MRALSTAASGVRHVLGAAVEALLIATIVATLIVVLAPVYAGADRLAGRLEAGAAANSITVTTSAGTQLAAGTGTVIVTTYATLARDYYLVYTRVTCTVDGRDVFEAWKNIKTGTWDTGGYASFSLDTGSWGGTPSCRADLLNTVMKGGHRVYKTLASADF